MGSCNLWTKLLTKATFATGDNFPSDLARRGSDLYVLYTHLGALLGGQPPAQQFAIQRVGF